MSSPSGQRPVPAPSGVGTMGRDALRVLGSRLAALYDATVVVALAIGAWSAPGRGAAAIAVVGVHAVALVSVCRRPRGAAAWTACLVSLAAAVVLTVGTAPAVGWPAAQLLVADLVSGAAVGLAIAAGPWRGAAAWLVGVASWVGSLAAYGVAIGVGALLGAVTTTVVAATVSVMIRRGFRTTDASIAAAEQAELARSVAEGRWEAQRRENRLLHDTVLATLTVLAHRGEGVRPDAVRSACARDAETLRQTAPVRDGYAVEPDAAAGAAPLTRLAGRWAARGLHVEIHGPAEDGELGLLAPEPRAQVLAAVDECLDNVRRHAGVDRASVVSSVADGTLRCVVVDEGRGFDLRSVAADRLGLLESVHGRMREIGGSATIWSLPSKGTSVLLRVPVAARPERGDDGSG
jgi:signal transduction histidine kinase